VKRTLCRILLTLSLLISVISLIAWPISYYRAVTLFHVGRGTVQHWSLGGGRVGWFRQGGPGTVELLGTRPTVPPGTWEVRTARDRTHYFDFNEYWRHSLRFHYDGGTSALASGAVVRRRHIVVPLWLPAWALAMPPAVALQRYRVRRRRLREGLCLGCGYDLRASADRCPECGQAAPPPVRAPAA
jgi:hypothetical protein